MKFEVNIKFGIGDTVYAVCPCHELEGQYDYEKLTIVRVVYACFSEKNYPNPTSALYLCLKQNSDKQIYEERKLYATEQDAHIKAKKVNILMVSGGDFFSEAHGNTEENE